MFFSLFLPSLRKLKMLKMKIDSFAFTASKRNQGSKSNDSSSRETVPDTSSKLNDLGGNKKTKRISKSMRAGLKMPVGKIHKVLKKRSCTSRVGNGAAIYMTAALEYVTAEVLEIAAQAAKDNKKVRISPRHLLLAIRHDDELSSLLGRAILAEGGLLPRIESRLLFKKTFRQQNTQQLSRIY